MIKIWKEVELTGSEMAEEFWNGDCLNQDDFFNKHCFPLNKSNGRIQLDGFVDSLDDKGREFIEEIYNSLVEWREYNEN